jgi:hypothetical protein
MTVPGSEVKNGNGSTVTVASSRSTT